MQEGNALMLHGYVNRHERYKLYTKTTRRIRLECVLHTEAFRRHRVSRSLADHDDSFVNLFEAIASICVVQFNSLTEDTSLAESTSLNAEDFLIELGRSCRDRDRARNIVQLLLHNGRITSDFGYRYLRPLIDNALIIRSARGVYVPSPQYRNAFRQMRAALGNEFRGAA